MQSKTSHMILALMLQLQMAAVTASNLSSNILRNLELEDDHDGEEEHHDEKPWGKVIGFTLIVNLATLSGVVFLIPVISRKARRWVRSCFWDDVVPTKHEETKEEEEVGGSFLDITIPSFASGALLGTAIFLVIPEAIYLIQTHLSEGDEHADEHAEDHDGEEPIAARYLSNMVVDGMTRFLNETDPDHDGEKLHEEHAGEILPAAIWRFGSALLGGFMLPMLFELLFPRSANLEEHFEGDHCIDESEDADTKDEEKHIDLGANVASNTHAHESTKKAINVGLICSIIFGDALHNFCDGVFIGVALQRCDLTIAYTIVGVTLYHEVAQELADYFLLTKHAGLKPAKALGLNFLAGLSVMIGGLVVVASDVSELALGVILSIASGVYLYIAACECLPRVSAVVKTRQNRALSMLMFIIGVIPIGLALLNHSHCEAEEGHEEH
ncbi:hypothetical protein CTEN210_12191 [Chaetoceros tenuissimus]|uniref:Uncharacterized protein n=1 Tax=Chaetoceros tenuissimus TaxID=426638 RepID=A0AAD3H9U8_9STRA|nr:hypothetical protein CTEN210_12191 [Chaetoceros tenuissimus]